MSFEQYLEKQKLEESTLVESDKVLTQLIESTFSPQEIDIMGGMDHILEMTQPDWADVNDLECGLNEAKAGNLKGLPKSWLRAVASARFGGGKDSEVVTFKKGVTGVKTIVTHLRAAAKGEQAAAFYLVQGGNPFALVVKDGYGKRLYSAILPDGDLITRETRERRKKFSPRGEGPKYRWVTFKEPNLSLTDIADRLAFTDDYEKLIPVDIIVIKADVNRAITRDRRQEGRAKSNPGTSAKALTKMAKTRLALLAETAVQDIVDQIQSQLTAVIESPETFKGFDIDVDSLNALTKKIQRITSSLQKAIEGVAGKGNASQSSRFGGASTFQVEVFLDALKAAK